VSTKDNSVKTVDIMKLVNGVNKLSEENEEHEKKLAERFA